MACVGQVRSYPLYPNPEVRREAGRVAKLTGPVATVDGVNVASKGKFFELAPGCHVVTLLRKIGEGYENAAWSEDLPKLVFAFKMTAGNVYSIETRHQMGTNQNGSVFVSAVERDGSGMVIGQLPPSRGAADVEACKQWEKAQEAQHGATGL